MNKWELALFMMGCGTIGGWIGASMRIGLMAWKVDKLFTVTKMVFDRLGEEGYGSDQQETPNSPEK